MEIFEDEHQYGRVRDGFQRLAEFPHHALACCPDRFPLQNLPLVCPNQSGQLDQPGRRVARQRVEHERARGTPRELTERSEEHTSELQSLRHLVCRLLLEKKKTHPTTGP